MNAFFLTILNMSISASWIVLAVLLLRVLLKKAPKWITVLLWGIVAIRLICPFSIESVMSLIPSPETINREILVEQAPVINPSTPVIDGVENPVINGTDIPVIGEPITPVPDTTPVNSVQTVITVLSYVWLAGMTGMLAYAVISYFRVKAKIGTAVRLRDHIFQSESVVSPFVLGLIKPKIYLPFCMDGQDMEYVIAHENAHIRRKDHWWKPIGFLILTLHWFNPLLWLGYVLLCRDIELACDEKVVKELDFQQKADYSQALLNCSVNRRIIAACPLAFGEVGIKERVKSVLNYKKPAFWIIVVAIIASIVTAVCFLTDPVDKKPDDATQQTDPSTSTESTDPSDTTDKKTPTTDAYNAFLDGYVTDTSVLYFTKDIDNNGTDELFIHENTAFEVYTYDGTVKKVGTHDFVTGTLKIYHTMDPKYPGIVYLTDGGGKNHFGYITLTDGALSVRQTFDDDYGMVSGKKEDVFYTDDEYLIAISRKAHEDLFYSIGYSVWEPKTTEDPYAIREITDGTVSTKGDIKLFNNGQLTLRVPNSWKCFTASGEDDVAYYFRDPVWGEKCQLWVNVTFAHYYSGKELTQEDCLKALSRFYEDVAIESLSKETIRGYACTKLVYSYTEDNTKFIKISYDGLIEGPRLYEFVIKCPAEERENYKNTFSSIMNSVQFLLTDGEISSLPLDEAYAYAEKQYKEDPLNHRLLCDLQSETQQIIKMGGQYYQSYVDSNVDIRYVLICRLEIPDKNTALWDWYAVGSSQVYSLDLLGKIEDGGKGGETDKIDPADMPLLSVLYNNQPFYSYEGPYSGNVKHTITDYHWDIWRFTVVDMDGDRKNELAVEFDDGSVLILWQDNGVVYGDLFGIHGMYKLFKNGTFLWNSNAGNIYGCSKLRFTEEGTQTTELWRVEHDGSGGFTCYVDDKQVSEAEYNAMIQQYNSEEEVWFPYGK